MLIAVAGLSGAGKTTAIDHLVAAGAGRRVYVGGYVQAEVAARGLASSPENERLVRDDMRKRFGRDVFAKKVVAEFGAATSQENLLLDSIYVQEEALCYRKELGVWLIIIGIEASFEVRAKRVAQRMSRPLSREELRDRDAYECERLGVDQVVAHADHRFSNDGELSEFKRGLDGLSNLWRRADACAQPR